jgi:CDP-diacylglycerol--glycerol-3-phosphate 3-phosphatidyltransferase
LLAILVVTGLSGLGVPYVMAVGLWLLAAASAFTVWQRMAEVHRQLSAGRA